MKRSPVFESYLYYLTKKAKSKEEANLIRRIRAQYEDTHGREN